MVEIKKNLKALDVKISKIAVDLGISRPTLDNYIELFEKGCAIPNEGYQKIFDYLFNTEIDSSIEFAKKYDYVKNVMLADATNGVKRIANEKRELALSDKVKEQVDSSLQKPLLEFINLFINNKDLDLVNAIYMYFNYVNGFESMDDSNISDKDKALFAVLSEAFEKYNLNELELDEENYNKVLEKNKIMCNKREVKVNDSDIVDYIQNNLNESTEIDIEVLKKMLASRKGN